MRRTAWLFLGLALAAPSFGFDFDENKIEQNESFTDREALDYVIAGPCGGVGCYVREGVPQKCADYGCTVCKPLRDRPWKGVCARP